MQIDAHGGHDVAHLVECFAKKASSPGGSIFRSPELPKTGVVVHLYNLSTQKVKAEGPEAQGYHLLYNSDDSLGYMRSTWNK